MLVLVRMLSASMLVLAYVLSACFCACMVPVCWYLVRTHIANMLCVCVPA